MHREEFVILNRQGKRMPATRRTPTSPPQGTALILHGLAGWKDQSTVVAIANAVTDAGYTSITFDGADCLRGPDASYRASTTTGFIDDVEDVVAFVRNQSWFTSPLIIAGHSLGALAALRYEKRHPGDCTKLLLIAPAISWMKDHSGQFLKKMRFNVRHAREVSKREQSDGEKYFMPLYPRFIFDFFAYDSRKDAPSIACPVLIVSAGDDLVVAKPAEHERLAKRFKQAEHVTIDGASHIFDTHERELADTIKQWLTSS